MQAAGLRIVAVGIGEPRHAKRYGAQLARSITCLSHPTPEVHERYTLKRSSAWVLLDPRLWENSVRATAGGHVQGHSTGDTAQLGGTFIVDTAGVLRYIYLSQIAGDHPSFPAILAACPTI